MLPKKFFAAILSVAILLNVAAIAFAENNPADDWIQRAIEYTDQKNYDKAIECLNEAVKINPADTYPRILLGLTYVHLENREKTVECFEEALTIAPNDAAL